jgi:hypothetical protein
MSGSPRLPLLYLQGMSFNLTMPRSSSSTSSSRLMEQLAALLPQSIETTADEGNFANVLVNLDILHSFIQQVEES